MIRLDQEKLEAIQTVLIYDDDGVSIRLSGNGPDDEGWYITNEEKIFEVGKKNKDGESEYFNQIKGKDFLKLIYGLDLIVSTSVKRGDQNEELEFKDWEHLAEYLGINKLVVLAVKVPEIIARRFEYFATQSGTKSDKLRRLIFEYVKKEWMEQADSLIYRSNV
jgi:hypothetical protein